MSIEDYYTESVSIMRYTTSTGWGDEPGWSTSSEAAAISASVNPIGGMERYAQDRVTLFADYKLHCSSTVDLDENDRVKWGTKMFNVVFVKDTLDMGHHKSVLMKGV
jgi:head-tail adaptor